MRARPALYALLALAGAGAAASEGGSRVVASVNQNRIAITAGFEGSEIFVYGAIARDAADAGADLGLVIKVQGPSEPVIVRRKDRTFGLWVNRETARIDEAPSFYAVATTGPFHDTISHTEDLRRRVSLEHTLRYVGARQTIAPRESFLAAIERLRTAEGLYMVAPGGVTVDEGLLFRARFALPASIVEGAYTAQVLLTRDREVIDAFETVIEVRLEGLERLVSQTATERPLLYGLLSIALAVAAALTASEAFRRLRR